MSIYRILENPFVYDLSQKILLFGQAGEIQNALNAALAGYESADALELGAGTGTYSPKKFSHLTLTDINDAYLQSSAAAGHKFVNCSATSVHEKFAPASFDVVYSVGLYHHLTDAQYHESIASVLKVLRPNGRFVVLDNMWPTQRWNLIAYALRKYDRGEHVRTSAKQLEILKSYFKNVEMIEGSYTHFHLEFVSFKCGL